MHFADRCCRDPLFQHTLVTVIRTSPDLISTNQPSSRKCVSDQAESWSGVPVVFDEVFSGIYRLGQFNCNSFLQVKPDVVVNAKLLTGGLVPLCTTIASQEIFEAFLSENKADALLHGHSYTAHAVGCNVAVESLRIARSKEAEGNWDKFSGTWAPAKSPSKGGIWPWSMWSKSFVTQLSYKPSINGVFALGCVLSISIKDPSGNGKFTCQNLMRRKKGG